MSSAHAPHPPVESEVGGARRKLWQRLPPWLRSPDVIPDVDRVDHSCSELKGFLHRPSIALLVAALFCGEVAGQEWTRFRGPNGSGVSTATGIPTTWNQEDFRWRIPIRGQSHSQPVVWGPRLFLTSALHEGAERTLLCVRKSDGQELWMRTFSLPTRRNKNRNSGYANGSPVVDEKRVIACFVSSDHFWVRSFDHEGQLLWERDLGPFDSPHGHGASPIIYESTVIVVKDQDGESFVFALDLERGSLVWQSSRRPGREATAYGTPALGRWRDEEPELLLASRSHGLSSLDPTTGTLNWEAPIFSARMVASPIVAGELIIGSCGQGGAGVNFLAAVKRGGKGDVGKTHVAYTLRTGAPCVPTPVFLEGRLYLISDAGIASALEAATGRVIWSERLRAEFLSSPVAISGKIYCASTKGEMIVLASGDEFNLLARNPLGEGTQSALCVDGGRLYVKTFTHLVSIGSQ